ncbi:Fpg/Nei family DNA glycosylase [Kocuria sp. HSID16901]|uniref:Fpg/Nei family DNA glycosylase n=1 Tax=Kocuria sp. HSID16901 TaxID=2419505 RepID=UPI000F882FBE|nr:DNA-formamidopyrimidine glycosylase family protein [Kocuria sp. HSID16901]RUQ22502.1 Fpg/Nei family DNA glycosylase [Kocuria sp. HSID16901]
MPEGHSIHRLARQFQDVMVGRKLRATSPQGRFAKGAALIDGATAVSSRAVGKHFFLEFDQRLTLNVHLGMYGAWTFGGDETFRAASSIGAPRKIGEREHADESTGQKYHGPPPPRPTTRVRLESEHGWADLVGATTCRILEPTGVAEVLRQLGPDPLNPEADPTPFHQSCARTSRPIAAVLMDQKAIAGIGNIYRAESLFRAGLNPHRAACELSDAQIDLLWRDTAKLMSAGVELGRIVTTAPEHRSGLDAADAWPDHAHYVYGRAGQTCRVCGERSVVVEDMAGRKLYWCRTCQA